MLYYCILLLRWHLPWLLTLCIRTHIGLVCKEIFCALSDIHHHLVHAIFCMWCNCYHHYIILYCIILYYIVLYHILLQYIKYHVSLRSPYHVRLPAVGFSLSRSKDCLVIGALQQFWPDALSETSNDPDGNSNPLLNNCEQQALVIHWATAAIIILYYITTVLPHCRPVYVSSSSYIPSRLVIR